MCQPKSARRNPEGVHLSQKKSIFWLLPASFEEIVRAVVRTRTPEEIEAMLAEERDERGRDKHTDTS